MPAGDGWTETEPFSGEIKNGRIYGRGTMDDKGPMVAAIYALAALDSEGTGMFVFYFQPASDDEMTQIADVIVASLSTIE